MLRLVLATFALGLIAAFLVMAGRVVRVLIRRARGVTSEDIRTDSSDGG